MSVIEKAQDVLVISVDEQGFGSFILNGMDISKLATGCQIRIEAGELTQVSLYLVDLKVVLQSVVDRETFNRWDSVRELAEAAKIIKERDREQSS